MAWLSFLMVTILWGLVGIGAPMMVPSSPQKFLIQTMLIMTAVCCWLHWLIAWMSQLNPLFGPVLSKEHAEIIQWSWEDK